MSKWIWMFGEFELYHSRLLHNRRQQYGYQVAPVWKIPSPETVVRFHKEVVTKGGEIQIHATGYFSTKIEYEYGREERYEGSKRILLEPGYAHLRITVSAKDSFPSLYVTGEVETDESWTADDLACAALPVGTQSGFAAVETPPDTFPFCYRPISYRSKEAVPPIGSEKEGLLFDFGEETFARITFMTEQNTLFVSLGESREEALDPEWSVIHMEVPIKEGCGELSPQAFRYIFVNCKDVELKAEYEYLPLAYRGSFCCEDEVINRIWKVAAYTFHLNSREFFLDGIKRDRWVWSGDAYQSLFVNRYLFLDAAIEQRTLVALGGKRPVDAYINTIMDYSYLWLMSLYEHYLTYGDVSFMEQIFPQATEVMQFCQSRTDEDGFVREKPGDWVFIDWAPMDKAGALCGEQILFAKALECYSKLCEVLGADGAKYLAQAKRLQSAVKERFYDIERNVFIDSYESGKNFVSRHSNILAYLFLPLTEEEKQDIYQNVVLNDNVQQITTPYFKFYENQVHCEAFHAGYRGEHQGGASLEASLRDYYGSMLDTGATSLYEEYDPAMTGTKHYAMYGHPYEKSLCHAWSASPIYLLGRYRMGVKNTGVAYQSFEVSPHLGAMKSFYGKVPVPGGEVTVALNQDKLSVLATIPGGTLVWKGKRILLEADKRVELETTRKGKQKG